MRNRYIAWGLWIAVAIVVTLLVFRGGTHTESDFAEDASVQSKGAKPESDWPPEVSALLKAYPVAGIDYGNLLMTERVQCVLAEAIGSGAAPSDQAEGSAVPDIWVEIQADQEARCNAYVEVRRIARPFAQEVAKAGAAQGEYYIFSILEEGDRAGTWTESRIGIFRTLGDCQSAERAVHEADVPTRQCDSVQFSGGLGGPEDQPSAPLR